jgi:hypothetical protein
MEISRPLAHAGPAAAAWHPQPDQQRDGRDLSRSQRNRDGCPSPGSRERVCDGMTLEAANT